MSKTPYIIGGATVGALTLGAVGLRLHALAKRKTLTAKDVASNARPPVAAATTGPISAGPPVAAVPGAANPAPNPVVVATVPPSPAVTANIQAAQDAGASAADIVVAEILAQQAVDSGAPASTAGQQAVVTTNDPPPSGDLIIRSAPSGTAPQIGGADKGGTVVVLDDTDPTFAKIAWGGGRWDACTGFARKAFLRIV